MKILILSPSPPPTDGIANHSQHIATELRAQGHEVHILSPGRGLNTPHVTRGLTWRVRRRDIELLEWSDAIFCQFAISALRAGVTGANGLMARARQMGKPVLVAMHEPGREPHLLGRLSWHLYHRALLNASTAVVFSSAAEEILQTASFRPPTLPILRTIHGVVLEAMPSLEEIKRVGAKYGVDERTALQLGFLHPDKGIESLIAAHEDGFSIAVAGTVRERRGFFRLMGIADSRYARRLHVLDSELGARVNWCGFVPGSEMRALVAAAGVIVLPYRSSAQSGIVAMAQSVGAPIVASAALEKQLEGGARIVDAANATELRNAILEVLNNQGVRHDLMVEAKKIGQNQSFEQLVRDLDEFIRLAPLLPPVEN
jgi:glycosyltransferase involved in cell wall biosynthesis